MFHVKHLEVSGENVALGCITSSGSEAAILPAKSPDGVLWPVARYNVGLAQIARSVVWACLAASVVWFFWGTEL